MPTTEAEDRRLAKSPEQSRIYRACVKERIPRVVVKAGRKFGKTFIASMVSRDWAIAAPGETILVGAPEYSYLRDQFVPELRAAFEYLPRSLKGGSWGSAYNKSEHILTLSNEAKILLRTMDNPDSVRPLSVAGLIAEEFSLWSRYAWEECVRPTLMAKQAPALFIFTPKGMNQAYELWSQSQNGNARFKSFHFTAWDGTLAKEVIDAETEGMPPGVVRQEYYAEFLDDLGGVFQGFRECIAGDIEDPITNEQYVIGCDVGEIHDFNVATVIKRNGKAVVRQVRFTGAEPETVAERFKRLSDLYNNAVIWIDDTGLGWGVANRVRIMGAPVKPYRFTAESKRRLIANLIMAISERSIRYPDIPELINELNIYHADPLPSGGVRYSAPPGYHDDCVMGLALACWGLGGVQITDFRPVTGRERTQLPKMS